MKASIMSFRRPAVLGLGASVGLFAGGIGWASLSPIDSAVIVVGVIETLSGDLTIAHQHGGRVVEVRRRDGDSVVTGDPVVVLDARELQSERTRVVQRLDEVRVQLARIEADRDGKERIQWAPRLIERASTDPGFGAVLTRQQQWLDTVRTRDANLAARLVEQRRQVREQIEGLGAADKALQKQTAIVAEQLKIHRGLHEKGLAGVDRVLELESETARIDALVASSKARIAALRARISELGIELDGIRILRHEAGESERAKLESERRDLAERLGTLGERIEAQTVRAIGRGVLFDVAVNAPGQVIGAGEVIARLVPQGSTLVARVAVPPEARDNVHQGQKATVRLSGIPDFILPDLKGTVLSVSANVHTDPRGQQSAYQADVAIGDDGGEQALEPGMPVSVFIRTGSRTALEYLLEPFTRYFTQAFRESS